MRLESLQASVANRLMCGLLIEELIVREEPR